MFTHISTCILENGQFPGDEGQANDQFYSPIFLQRV